jgi:LDH2 family malate/lactate/ureidoglycolate dehydrogenase
MSGVGHVALHFGLAVNPWVWPAATEGEVGLSVTESRDALTVISVEAATVVPFSVTFAMIPTVPEVVPAVKVTAGPLPRSEPIALWVRVHA